jgi:predicted GNAT family acetyltransferase
VEARDLSHDEAGYRTFRRAAMQRVAAMQVAGFGTWFGAFVGEQLVADCGLVHDTHLGRFQHVCTQSTWRRRGLCRTLVAHVCRHAFDALGLQQLVMCADPHDVAIGIYRSLGFVQVETIWCLQGRPSQ